MLNIFYKDLATDTLHQESNSMAFSEQSIQAWKNTHPGKKVLYVYPADAELMAINQERKDQFLHWCACTGFLPPDCFGTRFKSPEGDTVEIIGCKPRNRKYPILLMNLSQNRMQKCSASYVKAHIENK